MRRAWWFALLLLVLVPTGSAAVPEPEDAPDRFDTPCLQEYERRFVYDYTDVLPRRDGDALERVACSLYRETSVHLATVVVSDPDAADVETYALRLFESWGIGDAERQDGILLLVDLHEGNGTARLEVGYGLEDVVNSLVARDAVDAGATARTDAVEAGAGTGEALAAFLQGATVHVLTALVESGRFDDASATATPSGGRGISDLGPLGAPLLLLAVLSVGGGAYLYRDRFTRRRTNEWGDAEPTRWDYFFAGVNWREGGWEPEEGHAGRTWFRRGRKVRYLAFVLVLLNIVLSLLSGRRRGGGEFGGGRSGGGGNTGRL